MPRKNAHKYHQKPKSKSYGNSGSGKGNNKSRYNDRMDISENEEYDDEEFFLPYE